MVAINEVFGDRQSNDIAGLVIEANSLYFTVMANGVSRFYHSDVFIRLVEKIGFKVHRMVEHVGLAHTLLILTK